MVEKVYNGRVKNYVNLFNVHIFFDRNVNDDIGVVHFYFNKKYVAVDKASLGEFKDTIINKTIKIQCVK